MRRLISILTISLLLFSCKQEEPAEVLISQDSSDLVAQDIIYDVLIQAETDNPWEIEKVAGYKGADMINSLFESIYESELSVKDLITGEELSAKDIKKIDGTEGFERDKIGKLQFTEDWFYSPSQMKLEKKIKSIVFGYRSFNDDLNRMAYFAEFEVEFKQ